MNEALIQAWLKKKRATGRVQNVLVGTIGLFGGLLIIFFTFWFTYAIIWFGSLGLSAATDLIFGKKIRLSHLIRLIGSGGFVILLFIQYLWTNREYWGEYKARNYASAGSLQMATGLSGALASLLTYPDASAKMISAILLTGPSIVVGSVYMLARGIHRKQIGDDLVVGLLALLYSRMDVVTYEELSTAGLEVERDELRYIEGLVILEKGLKLSADLRMKLNVFNG